MNTKAKKRPVAKTGVKVKGVMRSVKVSSPNAISKAKPSVAAKRPVAKTKPSSIAKPSLEEKRSPTAKLPLRAKHSSAAKPALAAKPSAMAKSPPVAKQSLEEKPRGTKKEKDVPAKHVRTLTAAGWKRSMMKKKAKG